MHGFDHLFRKLCGCRIYGFDRFRLLPEQVIPKGNYFHAVILPKIRNFSSRGGGVGKAGRGGAWRALTRV
jgi:hypothetical protein